APAPGSRPARARRAPRRAASSRLVAAKDEPPPLEGDFAAVEVAPRADDVETCALEHRDQLMRCGCAERMLQVASRAGAPDERPRRERASPAEVELAPLEHDRPGLELLPVALLEPAREREEVQGVDQERAARSQRPRDRVDDALVVGVVVEVADDAREEVDGGVELGVERELACVEPD